MLLPPSMALIDILFLISALLNLFLTIRFLKPKPKPPPQQQPSLSTLKDLIQDHLLNPNLYLFNFVTCDGTYFIEIYKEGKYVLEIDSKTRIRKTDLIAPDKGRVYESITEALNQWPKNLLATHTFKNIVVQETIKHKQIQDLLQTTSQETTTPQVTPLDSQAKTLDQELLEAGKPKPPPTLESLFKEEISNMRL